MINEELKFSRKIATNIQVLLAAEDCGQKSFLTSCVLETSWSWLGSLQHQIFSNPGEFNKKETCFHLKRGTGISFFQAQPYHICSSKNFHSLLWVGFSSIHLCKPSPPLTIGLIRDAMSNNYTRAHT